MERLATRSIRCLPSVGSGMVIAFGVLVTLTVLICFGRVVGWDAIWSSIGVTPLQPHFFDMHVIIDYAACAAKGFDAYVPHSCNLDNFNVPPIWLWLFSRTDASQATWLSVAITVAALGVVIALCKGRSIGDGALALVAILSPSVLMGVERGNLDLLILALVGAGALFYEEQRIGRLAWSVALISVAVVLKLFPLFCVAAGSRVNRRAVLFASAIAVFSLGYLAAISHYILLIRINVPTTFILSYGYKALFLGLDQLRADAGLKPLGLADAWLPITIAIFTLLLAAATALVTFNYGRMFCTVTDSVAGTAFLFGSGIYCGTFLLGTNFIYRLMFLLLCLPQLSDWQRKESAVDERKIELGLFATVLSVLWLNGGPNGHTTFLLVPHLINWLLFFGLATVIMSNFLRNARKRNSVSDPYLG
jgi:hypothetical protein